MVAPTPRFELAPYDFAAARRLEDELGVSHVVAQVLVRRGYAESAAARDFLEAEIRHSLDEFGGLREAASRILEHVRNGSRIVVHGDYDCDGVTSTAILVRCLRTLGANVGWFLPSRAEDGYGLNLKTVERLAERGTKLLVTADCAITAVEEVAAAKAAGMDVVVTDHHTPRADGALPDAPIVHPRIGGYPCGDLCAAGVAHRVAGALLEAAGMDPSLADEDLDLVALATVADVVPLQGENRALVRAGLRRMAATTKPGLRALMEVAQVDPSGLDSTAIGFRLAPRINAAGRVARADAGLELLLTEDPERARAVAQELDSHNHERRDVETRILFEAEAQVAATPGAAAYVLVGDDWHPGVIGIVASRIAERHHRPTVLIAMDGGTGTGSGRSIPAFDLLAGLNAAAEHLLRHGGHRAAAGLTIERHELDAFRAAFLAHAERELTPEDLTPVVRVDAVAPGEDLGMALCEDLGRLAPFGAGNPDITLLIPCADLQDPRPMGDSGRHVSFTLCSGAARAKAVRFGAGVTAPEGPVDAAVRLEANAFNGSVEPRLVLRHAVPAAGRPIEVVGERPLREGVLAEADRDLGGWPPQASGGRGRELRDVRGGAIAALIADLVSTGDAVLVLAAHARHRAQALAGRVGGFAIADWSALADEPGIAARFRHVVALDPPAHEHRRMLLEHAPGSGWAHLAWGEPEVAFAARLHEWEHALREPLVELYRALRAAGSLRDEDLEAALRGSSPQPRTAALAGRLVRVLTDLGLAEFDRDEFALHIVETAGKTELERSVAYQAYHRMLEDGRRWLTTPQRAAA